MITWKRISLTYKLKEDMASSSFFGSLLRGGFGATFKREVCLRRDRDCTKCILKDKCPYLYIFETPIPKNTEIMRKYTSAPHPFVIEPPLFSQESISKGEFFSFNLILIGKGIEYLPYFIYTFIRLGTRGIGRNRAKAILVSVREGNREIFDRKNKLLKEWGPPFLLDLNPKLSFTKRYEIKLSFPIILNIRKGGKVVKDLNFDIFIRSLFRRLGLLEYFHNSGTGKYPFTPLFKYISEVEIIEKELFYKKIFRYSSRQKQKVPIEGITGYIIFKNVPEPFISYIKAAEDLHVGRNTSFGLGKLIVEYIK